jgi:hypothetical protein
MTDHKHSNTGFTRLLLLCAALFVSPLSGCATSYHAEAIEGWVVDAATEKPVEDVVIVARWTADHPMTGGEIEQVQIFETVTDKDGRYTFPAWGPKWSTSVGVMRYRSPEISLFKAGYLPRGVSNSLYFDRKIISSFSYNKQKLKLERFTGTLREYASSLSLSDLKNSLWKAGHDGGSPCGWKSFPRMLRALDALDAEFHRAGIYGGSVVDTLRANDARLIKANCGSINELLKP